MKTNDIITERLTLKSMILEDTEIAWSLWGNHEVAKYLSDAYYKNPDELRNLILDIDTWENEYPFIAYEKMWGNGYATEILRALIDFAYSLGIHDFQASAATENIASRRVMEKCGMNLDHESSFKKGGTDIVYPSSIYKMHID